MYSWYAQSKCTPPLEEQNILVYKHDQNLKFTTENHTNNMAVQ